MKIECISCQKMFTELEMAHSHIIPNFVRKRLTGELTSNGNKKYRFKWVNRRDLPLQDLPKPRLMCQSCDHKLGHLVEEKAVSLLLPHDVDDPKSWDILPIKNTSIDHINSESIAVRKYRYPNAETETLSKLSLSIAWRALHSMARENMMLSNRFINSERGKLIDKRVREYIFNNEMLSDVLPPYLYYLGPNFSIYLSNKNNEMPFAWAELGENDCVLGVGVVFGYWLVLWPLFDSPNYEYFDHLERLEKICFAIWFKNIKSDLK